MAALDGAIPAIIGAANAGGSSYEIERSLRFDTADSAYLNRSPSSTSNKAIWTLSFWIKICNFSLNKQVFTVYSDSNNDSVIRINGNNYLEIYNYRSGSYQTQYISNGQFRDPSAWYHFVVSANGSTSLNAWVNGEAVTWSTSSGPNGVNWLFNSTNNHQIGLYYTTANSNFYLAEVNWIDGQALAETDFGEYDSNNVWQPKQFGGSYGTADQDGTSSPYVFTNLDTVPNAESNVLYLNSNPDASSYPLIQSNVSSNDTIRVKFASAQTGVTSIKFRGGGYSASSSYYLFVNGTQIGGYHSTNSGWGEDSHTISSTDITEIKIQGSDGFALGQLKFNDTLVPGTPSYGTSATGFNSFYLNFSDNSSNAALGTDSSGNSNTWTVNNITAKGNNWNQDQIWSNSLTASSGLSGATNAFDGDVSTRAQSALGSYQTLTFGPSTGVSFTSTLEVYCDQGSSTPTASWNGNTVNPGGGAWVTVFSGSGTIDSSTPLVINTQGASQYATLKGVRLDGNILVDTGVLDSLAKDIDSLIDTPTDYTAGSGNNGGNYCTLSPLKNAQTLSNGNLDVVGGSSWQRSVGSLGMFSGKYYWEYEITASNEHLIGVGPVDMQLSGNLGAGSPPGSGYGTELGQVNGTGANGSWSNTGGSTTGDIIGIAFDADNGNMYVYKNGSSLNGGIASHTGLVMPQIPVVSLNGSSRSGVINFGQRPFAYTPPTGYVSLCTTNLPDPAIADGSTEFDTTLYSGNDSQRDITGLGFSPDFVWIKKRNGSSNHSLMDTVRGATKNLVSNDTQAEGTEPQYLNAFLSDGFSLGTSGVVNDGSSTYVAWAWEASDTTTTVAKDANGTNLPGATCEYRANTTNGFSVVKVADPQSNEARVHGLGVAPDFFICKSTASADSWHTYWKVLGRSYYINLNGTGPASSSDQFGSQEPDSTYFYVKSNTGSGANKSGGMVYYLWNAVDQYSAFGEYLGNGNADGPFVFTGFRPKWIVFKMRSGSGDWRLMDTSRDLINPCDAQLYPNNTDAESSSSAHEVDYLSNGFKVVTSHPAMNTSGQYYLYAAFAEHPFKTSRAR